MEQVRQEGGDHYQQPVQHWDWAQHLPYLEGCATKYFGRHQNKNGLEDIRKGLSFVDKICRKYYKLRLVWRLEDLEEPECDYNPNQDREV